MQMLLWNEAVLRASVGGLLRDNCGSWIVGFRKNVGACSVQKTTSEYHGGLQQAWFKEIRRLIVENDNITILCMLNGNENSTNLCALVQGICVPCRRLWEIKFEHVFQEANKAAFGLHIHDYPPIGAANFCHVIQQEPRLLGMALFKLLPEYSATIFTQKKKSRINKGFIATISPRNGIAMVRNWKR
uniref:RNase H type-1 domain-containing protein n=1 Tax=Gossypium raimondii TaxID=29730 RepID=A0A0D2QS89_GOSRA|nr:hypothetical protein B456_004G050600 [Gossypium raimondii]